MGSYVLKSYFKEDIQQFLNLKHSTGYKYTTGQRLIEQFDFMCYSKYPKESTLTEEIGIAWAIPREDESASATINRIVDVREFAKYLINLNKKAFMIPSSYFPKKRKYISYIYTNYELQKIFDVIDNGKFTCRHKNSYIVYPIIFRLFYCCGLRNSEVRNLKVKDIDLNKGIIAIYESKNDSDRLVPISDKLQKMILKYAKEIHSNSRDEDYFFYLINMENLS